MFKWLNDLFSPRVTITRTYRNIAPSEQAAFDEAFASMNRAFAEMDKAFEHLRNIR
jgi:hypothetical protein